MKLLLIKSVVAEGMGLGSQGFCKNPNFLAEVLVLLTRNNAYAARCERLACEMTGSTMCSARNLTTGTTTPSPVK